MIPPTPIETSRGAPNDRIAPMSGSSWRLLVLMPLGEDRIRRLFESVDADVAVPAARDREGLHEALGRADLVVGDFTGKLAMDTEAVDAAPHLAFVQMPSVGVDSCDLPALTAADVPVANTPEANARSVAEWALAAAFALSRSLLWADRRMREGGWPQLETAAHGADELANRRVGILGMGAIGTEAMRLFAAIGCPVSYWSRRRRPAEDHAGEYKEIDELLATSDVVVVCLPRTDETRGLLDARRLGLMPKGALLVNVARGGIAPDEAVLAALDGGRLAGAALDVYDEEPLPADHPLRAHEKVLLSPHCAGATRQAQINVISMVIDNVRAVTEDRPVAGVVNDVDPVVRRR
jgi:D-3-phosphoglycerate dehydrogenase